MKKILLLLTLLFRINFLFAQVDTTKLNICSWNIQNFGRTKSSSQETMDYIVAKIKNFDIVAIQEVSTSEFGAQAVAKLDDLLDRTGTSWDFVISDPTKGPGSERYAYVWKKSRVKLKSSTLEKSLQDSIDREPFRAIFIYKTLEYALFNVHLVPTDKNPEVEAKRLSIIGRNYPAARFLIMGDFNLSQSSPGFNLLKNYTKPALTGKKTSLKMKEDGSPLNMEYDNFFMTKNINLTKSEVIEFFKDFKDLKSARKISDHCPIFCIIK